MPRKTFSTEQIINKLRAVELEVGRGMSIQEAIRKIEVTEQTYYRWRKVYGTLHIEQAKRLRELEKENSRLRKVVADMAIDNAVLKDAALGK
jgi:transposase-like protein